MSSLSFPLVAFSVGVAISCVQAAEPFFKPADVVALVGGEDMVAAAECGELELRVVSAWPNYRIKFRSLAWEGDTVFEQARQLNYPMIEQQLDEMGATVVIAQFGQMESLAGPSKLADFARAYEKLIERFSRGGKRRVVLLEPTPIRHGSSSALRFASIERYADVIRGIAERHALRLLRPDEGLVLNASSYRDDIHLNERGQQILATRLALTLGGSQPAIGPTTAEESRLLETIRDKNRLWFHYVRPQNWAFLNGDRTVQPSSRDHLDPSKRWFPEEMKQWLPLIESREEEIWKLVRKPGSN